MRAPSGSEPLVGVERLLRWSLCLRDVTEVHTDAGPRAEPPAHGIDEHVGCAQVTPATGSRSMRNRRDGRGPPHAPGAGAARDRRGWPSSRARPDRAAPPPRPSGRTENAAWPPRSTPAATAARASGRRTRPRCRSGSAPVRTADPQRRAARPRPPRGSSERGRVWCVPPAERALSVGSRSTARARRLSAPRVRRGSPREHCISRPAVLP